jgi:hypothetical protein
LSKAYSFAAHGVFSARHVPALEHAPLVVIAALAELDGLDRETAFSVVDRAVSSGAFSQEASDAWFKGCSGHRLIEFEDAFSMWLQSATEPIASREDAARIVIAYALQCFVNDHSKRGQALECVTQAELARMCDNTQTSIGGELYWYQLNYIEVVNRDFDEARTQAEFAKLDADALLLAERWLDGNASLVKRLSAWHR